MNCAIIYPFFAKYRQPVMQALLDCPEIDFWLVGDNKDCFDSEMPIKAWVPDIKEKFIKIKSFVLFKHFLLQMGIFQSKILGFDKFIILGDYKHISTWLFLIVAKLLKKPVYLWTHGWTSKRNNFAVVFVRNSFYKLSAGLLLYGNYAHNISAQYGFKKEFSTVIFNSLDYKSQKSLRMSLGAPDRIRERSRLFTDPNRPILFVMGRLTPKLEITMLLRALQILDVPINLIVLGSGLTLPNKLKSHEIIHIQETFSESEIANAFNASDIFVYPGFVGLSAIHAMAYGLPVITKDPFPNGMPESEAIIDGVTGSLYKPNDPFDLAKVLKMWINIENNKRMSAYSKCIQIVETYYTPEVQVDLIVNRIKRDSNEPKPKRKT